MDTSKEAWYITDGLFLHLDGILNTRNGHMEVPEMWEDLSGNEHDFVNHGAIFNKNHLQFNGAECLISQNDLTQEAKMAEIVIQVENSVTQCIMAGYSQSAVGRISYKSGCILFGNVNKSIESELNEKHYLNSELFKDGVKQVSKPVQIAWSDSTNEKFIGGRFGSGIGAPYGFIGKIYALRLYDRILTEEEILHNFEVDKQRFNIV